MSDDNDKQHEELLRKALLKAHFQSDEDPTAALVSELSSIVLPDRVFEHPGLEKPVRLQQKFVLTSDAEPDVTGAWVWDSAPYVADWLITAPEAAGMLVGRSVLELGAGLGLCSIVLAQLGAERVTLTDGESSVVEVAAANVALNNAVAVHAATLRWGSCETEQATAVIKAAAASMVVASDVLYEETGIDELEQTLRGLIRRGGVRHVIIGWRERGHDEEGFFERMRDLGSVVTARSTTDSEGRRKGVSVFTVGESSA